jgi:prepilin-type N-terminal cleavage/methylation domain-containing protein
MITSARQVRGFTLIELLVAVAILAALTVGLADVFGPSFSFYQKIETKNKLDDLKSSIERAYQAEDSRIGSVNGQILSLVDGTLTQVLPTADNVCLPTTTTFAPLARYLPSSASVMQTDGHGQGMCVFVSNPIAATVSGAAFTYRAIAVVSAGADGTIHATTVLNATGSLVLGGDDRGILIDGRQFIADKFAATQAKVDRIVQAYGLYFQTRYLGNSARDISVDYFASTNRAGAASARHDTGGSMPTTGGASVSITSINAHTVLGLTVDDVTDAYGQVIRIDNSSDNVKNPENSTAALSLPPYSALISTTLPGGVVFSRSVVGAY